MLKLTAASLLAASFVLPAVAQNSGSVIAEPLHSSFERARNSRYLGQSERQRIQLTLRTQPCHDGQWWLAGQQDRWIVGLQ